MVVLQSCYIVQQNYQHHLDLQRMCHHALGEKGLHLLIFFLQAQAGIHGFNDDIISSTLNNGIHGHWVKQ